MASRILLAPACFKGSLSAPAVAEVMRAVLREHLPANVSLDVCPVADGGDDTLLVLQTVDPGFAQHQLSVMGPVPTMTVVANYLVHPRKRLVVIEAAQAHGLKLLPPDQLAPMAATSYGVGELIRHAITNEQPETILVALGGSASTDGGLGALQVLGVRFLDAKGKTIREPIGGQGLADVQRIDWPPSWGFTGQLLIATDVVNPLLGSEGTATVFAPQKGATKVQCETLEANLTHIRPLMTTVNGMDYAALPGVGAAGGLAYGLRHLPQAGIVSGSQWVAQQLDLIARIGQADLIITGEGCFDATSFGGKATGNILVWADDKPVMVVCGQARENLAGFGQVSVYPLVSSGESAERAMAAPDVALRHRMQELIPTVLAALA